MKHIALLFIAAPLVSYAAVKKTAVNKTAVNKTTLDTNAAAEIPDSGKLTLAQAESIALRHAPQISAAFFRAQAAKEVVTETRSAFFPQVDAEFSAVGTGNDIQNTLGGGDHVAGRDTRIGASGALNNPLILSRQSDGVLISQLITDFGRTANLTSAARFHAKSAEERANLAREVALFAVDKAYIGALEGQALYEVAKKTVEARQTVLDQVTAQVNSQLKSELDLSFAQVSVGQAKLLVVQAERAMNDAQAELSAALGLSETRHFDLVDDLQCPMPTESVGDLTNDALKYRPEMIGLRADYNAATRFASAQHEAMFPKIVALGAMGRSPVGDAAVEGNYSAGGVNVELPVFNGGRLSAQYREALLRAKEAQKNLEEEQDAVIRDVNVAWFDLQASNERIAVAKQLVGSASEALQLSETKFNLGTISIVELSQAQLSDVQAEIEYASAKFEYQLQCVRLQFETGALRFRTPSPRCD